MIDGAGNLRSGGDVTVEEWVKLCRIHFFFFFTVLPTEYSWIFTLQKQ